MEQVKKAAELFSLGIEALARKYGESQVAQALKQYNQEDESADPSFSAELDKFIEGEETITEILPAAKTAAQLAAPGVAKALGKTAGKGWLASALAGAATSVGTDLATSAIDRDVDIADISTSKKLNVASPDLEALISNTNDSIEKMTKTLALIGQDLSTRLEDVDVSVDDIIASETGESSAEISKRQSTRQASAKPEPGKKDKKDKEGKLPDAVLKGSPVGQ